MVKQISFLLIVCSILFIATTPLSSLGEHAIHIFPLIGLTVFTSLLALFQSNRKISGSSAYSSLLSGIAIFSLFLFVTSHVIPTHMLVHQHGAVNHTSVEHPCCVALTPTISGIQVNPQLEVIGEIQPNIYTNVVAIFIQNNHNKSPPVLS